MDDDAVQRHMLVVMSLIARRGKTPQSAPSADKPASTYGSLSVAGMIRKSVPRLCRLLARDAAAPRSPGSDKLTSEITQSSGASLTSRTSSSSRSGACSTSSTLASGSSCGSGVCIPYFHVSQTSSCEHGLERGDSTRRFEPPASTTSTSADCGGAAGPSVDHSATGMSPVWRVNDTLRADEPHHLVLTWNLPAHYVEVRGTFTSPPWSEGLPMWWCPRTQSHWIDLHESVPKLSSGLVQFKFVADGTWKCDPNYPICDDGSPKHSHNNVCVIFPQRIRLRLSNQKLRRRQSILTTLGPPEQSGDDGGGVGSPSGGSTWVCGNNSPRRCGRQLSRLSRKIQRSNHNTLSSKPAWASSAARRTPLVASKDAGTPTLITTNPSTHRASVPTHHHPVIKRTPTISGTGCTTAQQCRKFLIEQSTALPSTGAAPAGDLAVVGAGADSAPHSASRAPVTRGGLQDRRREKQKHLDTLVRCLSHHGGRRHRNVNERASRERSRIAHWPSYITSLLHDPDVMLELDLPKVLKVRNENLSLRSGWSMACHPEKRLTGGADSFYISSDGNVMALADGVGAWDELGVNSRDYADELINGVRDVWENKAHKIHQLKLEASLVARELMYLGSRNIVSYGSATCCIVIFDAHRQEIGVCNLGDSGVCLLRRNNLSGHVTPYFKTPDMIHFFNCPYQLSKIPSRKIIQKKLGARATANSSSGQTRKGGASKGRGFILPVQDSPKNSECFDIKVEEGDLIVLASDGLWDNLWSWEISSLCTLTLTPLEALILHDDLLITEANDIAKALTEAASYKSQNPKSTTPFAKNYTAECGMPNFTGGKWDDITVLCSWVARKNSPALAEVYGADGELLLARESLMGACSVDAATHREEWRWPYVSHSDGDISSSDEE